jgi:hypothetical protein
MISEQNEDVSAYPSVVLAVLWRCQLWRWFVIAAVHSGRLPEWASDWFFYDTGFGRALEEFFRDAGDWQHAQQCREQLRWIERERRERAR